MNDGSQSEPTDGPTSVWRQRSVVEVVVVIVADISPLEFPLGNGDPGPHDFLENSFHMIPRLDYLHSLETFL